MIPFSVIAAVDAEGGIGRQGGLPWHLPGELAHFKHITVAPPGQPRNAVIMGRRTWDSLPERFRPLPQRLNIVLTSSPREFPAGVWRAAGLEESLQRLALSPDPTGGIFVIGGGAVFAEGLRNPACRTLYLTRLHAGFDCDTFFPSDLSAFTCTGRSETLIEREMTYHFETYQRKI